MISKEEAFINIKNDCEKRICEVYPAGVPEFVSEELKWELEKLKNSEYILKFELYRLVNKAAKKALFPVSPTGIYIIGYLLGYMTINPLRVHYYCPECGNSELADESLTEFELPDKKCSCGCDFWKYGMNVRREYIWGTEEKPVRIGMSVWASEGLQQFARNEIIKEFDEKTVKHVSVSKVSLDLHENKKVHTDCGGFTIVPDDYEPDFPPVYVQINQNTVFDSVTKNDVLMNNYTSIDCTNNHLLTEIRKYQQITGIYADEIKPDYTEGLKDIGSGKCNKYIVDNRKIFQTVKPDTFKNLAALFAMDHNTFTDGDRESCFDISAKYKKFLIKKYEEYLSSEYPIAFREDAMLHLKNAGMSGDDLNKAYRLFKLGGHIRKKEQFDELMDKYNIPDKLREAMNMYHYCFPKYYCYSIARYFMIMAEYLRVLKKN